MRFIIFILSLLFSFETLSQKNYFIEFTTQDYKQIKKNIPLSFKDSLSAQKYLVDFQLFAIKQGYVLASYDSLFFEPSKTIAHFFCGQKFPNLKLNIELEDLKYLKKHAAMSEKVLAKIPFTPSEISRILKGIHQSTTNNGYPFSKVQLTNIVYDSTFITADLSIDKGKRFVFKEIHIKGDSSISSTFISSLINIKEGDYYDESKLASISKKVKQLSFIKEIKPHELLFTKEGVEIFLYLNSNPVSSINGAIGLQPNNVTKKIGVTGDLSLKLLNVLKHGEALNLNWRSIQPQTQALDAKLNYPFIFKSPFGIDGQFHLYKRDTTFLELKTTIGVQYFLRGGSYLKAFYQNNSSLLLDGASNNPSFNNLASVKTNAYGLSIYRKELDYIPNPSKGLSVLFEIAIGTRKKEAIDTIPPVRSTTYKSSWQIDWFIPLTARNVLHFSNSTDVYYAPIVYQNEVFRFGGLTTLRGFNEEAIYATSRTVFSAEYRFLLDRNSNVFAFFDQAFYENNATKYVNDHPYGFGAGFSFGTNIGIFSISYALGKQFDNPILMRNGKIHFGYIAYF